MCSGYEGSLFATTCCQSSVSLAYKRVLGAARSPGAFCDYRLGCLVPVVYVQAFFLPALSLFPGLTPAVYLRLLFRNLLLETRYAPADCLQHELVALGKASLHGIANLFLAALQPPAGHAAPCPG